MQLIVEGNSNNDGGGGCDRGRGRGRGRGVDYYRSDLHEACPNRKESVVKLISREMISVHLCRR